MGWVLSELSGWFKKREEHRRVYRHVVFQLLELYFLLRRIDALDVEAWVNRIVARLPKEARTPEVKQQLGMMIKFTIDPMLKEITVPKVKALGAGFEAAVEELSRVDPLTAFKLRGRTELIDQLDLMTTVVERVRPSDQAPDKRAMEDHLLNGVARPTLLKQAMARTRKEILGLALRCGVFEWWRIMRSNALSAKPLHNQLVGNFDEHIEVVVAAATKAWGQQPGSNGGAM